MTPICPACGCALVGLEIDRANATPYEHRGAQLLFCCGGCVEIFKDDPERYLDKVREWFVRPNCLAEKSKRLTVAIDHGGREVHFCRCPGCVAEFKRRPEELFARLAA